jgi:hypothetical protein
VDELDRVFDGDDVLFVGGVDAVDDGGQRRRLARAGRPGDQDQPLLQVGQGLDRLREVQVLDGDDLFRNDAEDRAAAVLLEQEVGAEAGDARQAVGEVEVAARLVLLPVRRGRDLAQEHA